MSTEDYIRCIRNYYNFQFTATFKFTATFQFTARVLTLHNLILMHPQFIYITEDKSVVYYANVDTHSVDMDCSYKLLF